MTSRNTKPSSPNRRAIKGLAFILPALVMILGVTELKTPRVARAAGPSVVAFSAATYAVTEDTTFRTITVNRTGDISGPATVDYATTDVSASDRSDYTPALGTLRFAANQSSRTFDVLIIEDVRLEGNETFNITLSNGTGQALLGTPSTATVTINDDPIEAGQNPINFPGNFVGQHYHDFLARQSDPDGEAFWVSQITSCGSNPNCIDDRRTNVSAAFFLSIEFQDTGYFVIRTHKAAFGSAKGTPVYLTFLRDQRRISEGVIIGDPGADLLLEANRQAYLSEFVTRPAFVALFPIGMNGQAYVDTLFGNSLVIPTVAERQAAIFAYGGGNTAGRAAALESVAESNSVFNAQYNPAFVLMQYYGYMRRNPDAAPDGNFNGYDFWLEKLNSFSVPGEDVRDDEIALNRIKRSEMVRSFVISGEYRGRFQ